MYEVIKDRKIRVAVMGCGRISANHFASIKQYADDIELVAVCDNDKVNLEIAQTEHGVEGFRSLSKMLASIDLDVVSLCTPSGLHSNQVIEIAAAGKHVVSEKPMATRWKDGLDMVKACDRAGVRLFIVKQNRRNTTLQLLKRAMSEGRFGKIYMVNLNVFWTRPQEYYDSAKCRGTWELDGGAFMNQASHYVDLIDWLIGPVEKIQAMTGTLARDIEVEEIRIELLQELSRLFQGLACFPG